MKKRSLPPKAATVENGEVQWAQIEGLDFQAMGYFLSCHLIVEHYLDLFLKTNANGLNWKGTKLTFAQKVSLISKLEFKEPYIFIPALKHLNTLRNKFSHDINFCLSQEDLLPFKYFIQKVSKKQGHQIYDIADDADANDVLENFTHSVCAWLGGAIWAHESKYRNSNVRTDNDK